MIGPAHPARFLAVTHEDRALFMVLFNIPPAHQAVITAGRKDDLPEMQAIAHFRRAIHQQHRRRPDAEERAARALYEHWVAENIEDDWAGWEMLGDKETWRSRAKAAIAAQFEGAA